MISPSPQVMANLLTIWRATPSQDGSGAPQYIAKLLRRGVPCSIQPTSVMEIVDEQGRVTQQQAYEILFPVDPGVNARDKLQYIDSLGFTRTLFAQATRNEAGRDACFTVVAIEKL